MSEEKTAIRLSEVLFNGNELLDAKVASRLAGGRSLRCCYRSGMCGDYAVKIGLGSAQWELGLHRDRTSAVRLADMAIVYFWKYRRTRKLPPVDSDLNFSVEQANRDLADYPQATAILDKWAEYFLKEGVIRPIGGTHPEGPFDYSVVRSELFRSHRDFIHALELIRKAKPDLRLHFVNMEFPLDSIHLAIKNIDRILNETSD